MNDAMVKELFAPPQSEPDFKVGQTVRVISRIDVDMPSQLDYWLDTKCEVLLVVARGFGCREWCYKLRHPNGRTCEFTLEELDLRFRRKAA